jgi:hypothetical protein
MGATPAAPVAAGVAFSWRSSRAGSLGYGSASNLTHWWSPPGNDKRNSTGVERASDLHSAQIDGRLKRRWIATCRTWKRMQRRNARLPPYSNLNCRALNGSPAPRSEMQIVRASSVSA